MALQNQHVALLDGDIDMDSKLFKKASEFKMKGLRVYGKTAHSCGSSVASLRTISTGSVVMSSGVQVSPHSKCGAPLAFTRRWPQSKLDLHGR